MSDSDFISHAQHEQEETLFDSGGTCDCYRLVRDNRVYCIKRPKKDMRTSEVYMSLFRKEFELGIELEHPNIVRFSPTTRTNKALSSAWITSTATALRLL